MQTLTSFHLFLAVIFVGFVVDDGLASAARERRAAAASDSENIACSEVQTAVPTNIKKRFRTNTKFYKKYITVYGIPIFSSAAVDDRALQRACYTVRFLLAGWEDLREGMRSKKLRVVVMGSKENMLELPEYRMYRRRPWMAKQYANRRGSGGTIRRPITVVAEENLLSEKSDPYGPNQDISVHELAHAIHLIACKAKWSWFDGKLRSTFVNARQAGLWNNTYAGTNHKEYFAMGVQSYLNQQYNGPIRGDGTYNSINTRTELMEYDLPLYHIINQVLSCPNTFIPKSSDIDQSKGASQDLQMNCGMPTSTA